MGEIMARTHFDPRQSKGALLENFGRPNPIEFAGRKYYLMHFPSVRAAHIAAKEYIRHDACSWTSSPKWVGLPTQTIENWDSTGNCPEITNGVKAAIANLPEIRNRPGHIRPSVAGGYFCTPDVIAGIPTSARIRIRSKLQPINLRLAFSLGAGVDSEDMAPLSAKISRAIWNYTQAGGVVTLRVYKISTFSGISPDGYYGAVIETNVDCTDIAAVALALSPAFSRGITAPLSAALSPVKSDGLPVTQDRILGSGVYYITGPHGEAIRALENALAAMSIVS